MPGSLRTENGCTGETKPPSGQALSQSAARKVPTEGQMKRVITFPSKILPASTNLSLRDYSAR